MTNTWGVTLPARAMEAGTPSAAGEAATAASKRMTTGGATWATQAPRLWDTVVSEASSSALMKRQHGRGVRKRQRRGEGNRATTGGLRWLGEVGPFLHRWTWRRRWWGASRRSSAMEQPYQSGRGALWWSGARRRRARACCLRVLWPGDSGRGCDATVAGHGEVHGRRCYGS